MTQLAPISDKPLSQMTEPEEVCDVWRRAEALASVFSGEKAEEKQRVILIHRNEAMRALGRMYSKVGFGKRGPWAKRLDLSPSEVRKLISIMQITDAAWTNRRDKDGKELWAGTAWGTSLKASLAQQKERCAAASAMKKSGPEKHLQSLKAFCWSIRGKRGSEMKTLISRLEELLKEQAYYQDQTDHEDEDVIEF